jgi:hypothetical protein
MEPVPGKVVQIKSGLLSNLASALYFYKKIEKIDQKKKITDLIDLDPGGANFEFKNYSGH